MLLWSLPMLAMLLGCSLTTGQVYALNIDHEDYDNGEASDGAFARIVDFRVIGLFNKTGDMVSPGNRIVNNNKFFLYIFSGASQVPLNHLADVEYFSAVLSDGQPLDNLLSMIVIKSKLMPEKKAFTCSLTVAIGPQTCPIINGFFVKVEITERIKLRRCRQSSSADPSQQDSCERAYASTGAGSGSPASTSCAVTARGDKQPWWRAEVSSSFLFEKIRIHASADMNEWTRNFDIFIEETICAGARDGAEFVKKTFECGLHGSRISVRGTGTNLQLAICELVAYGSPGGCFDIHLHSTRCRRELPGHIGQGGRPYPAGLNCQWVLTPHSRPVALLLQFPEFGTAGPQDYVALYEGRGTSGKLLAKFYGNEGATLPPRYERPGIFGAERYVLSGNISNSVTVQFVTARAARGGGNGSVPHRTVQTHRGFVLAYTVVRDDFYAGDNSQKEFDELKRVCNPDAYAARLVSTCAVRGYTNPVYLYGNETGGPMLKAMQESGGKLTRPPINVALMQEKLGPVPYDKLPELDGDTSDKLVAEMCGVYENPHRDPPRYFGECCCNYCSRRQLSKYCLWTYGEPDNCLVDLERMESEPP